MTDRPSILFACKASAGKRRDRQAARAALCGGCCRRLFRRLRARRPRPPRSRRGARVARLDGTAETPRGFDPAATYSAVITMGCGEACPFFAGARYEDWELDDPKGQDEPTVRRIVADIDGRVRCLLTELLPSTELPRSVFAACG